MQKNERFEIMAQESDLLVSLKKGLGLGYVSYGSKIGSFIVIRYRLS